MKMAVRGLARLLVIAAAITCLHWFSTPASAASKETKGIGAKGDRVHKGINLFHAGDDSLTWSNQELTRMRTLHTRDFNSIEEFLGYDNLAEYFGLLPVESLHLPVPLNVILVGFAGDGNAGVNISLSELNQWFEHVDHVLPHTRIDRSELTCQEDGQCAGLVHGRFHPTPMPSYVHLNFSCNVVLIKRRNVVDAFERAIAAFSRPVDPEVATGMQQVDASKMEAFIDNFIGALGLDTSYSLVVLNPTWHADEPVYGYRMGVSQQELQLLKGSNERLRKVMASMSDPEPILPAQHRSGWNPHRRSYPHGNVVASKFSEKDSTWESERWVSSVSSYLGQEELFRRVLLEAAGPGMGGGALLQAARMLARPGSLMGGILRKDLLENWADAADVLHSIFHTAHPAEDCMVNTWVGTQGRWVMVDLTAGGKDWGPALGGDGVVHYHSLPQVAELFGSVKRIKQYARDNAQSPGSSEHAVVESLAQARASRLPSVANRHHHTYLLKKQAARRAATMPGSTESPPINAADEEQEERAWRVQHQMVLLQAELDLLEEWALRHCNNNPQAPLVCGNWKEEAVALRAGLAKLHGATSAPAAYELFRDHRWEIFGEEQDLTDLHPELWDEEEISHDTLLGEMAGVLSRAIRHVIAPPTASWHGRRLLAGAAAGASGTWPGTVPARPKHATAPPFAHQVNFHIVIISDDAHVLKHANADVASFDVHAYEAAVEHLKVPNQDFRFHVTHVTLLDEPVLAAAVAAATRTTLQEIPTSEDFFDAEAERVYVDSSELAATLRRHFPPTRQQLAREEAAGGRPGRISLTAAIRDVPVYVLQLKRDVAVLLDEHYNARALEDMILVVANSARRDEHPTGMMCGGMLVARPISPIKEALAATLLHLGGVLPPHLGYNPRSHAVTHDWLWSVGAHPLSFTSTGLHFTAMQRDALARSYLLDALDTSVAAVNAAIGSLMRAKPSAKLFKHIKDHQTGARDLLRKYGEVVSIWRSAVSTAYSLDFGTALDYLKMLEGEINGLAIHATAVTNLAEPVRCSDQVVDRVSLLLPLSCLGSAGVALAALMWAAAPWIFMRKAKTN